jgi:hypothetical protein
MRAFLLTMALLVPVRSALAQQPAQQAAQPPAVSGWQRVQALPAGTSINVKARKNNANCILRSVDADTLTCTHGKDIVIQRSDIVNIKVPHRGRSTLAGLAIGAGAGVITGYASPAGESCSNICILGPGSVATVAGVAFGTIGAIVGAFTDFTKFTVYKAP